MSLFIEASVKTPKISFDTDQGNILISGISIPEDPQEFYSPLHNQIEAYLESPKLNTLLEFKLEYFNTSSTLIIRNIIRKLESISENTNLVVKWYYEKDDEDMQEAGSEFKLLFKDIQFEIVKVAKF